MELTLVTKPGPDTEELDIGGLVSKHLMKKLEKIEHRIGGTGLTARAVLEELSVGFEATITIQGKQELVGKAKEPELLRAVDAAPAAALMASLSPVSARELGDDGRMV